MKKLLLLICLVFVSCSQSMDTYDEKESKERTSLSVLSAVDSTLQVSITQDRVYLLQEGKVVREGYLTTNEEEYIVVDFIALIVLGLFGMALWSIFLIGVTDKF